MSIRFDEDIEDAVRQYAGSNGRTFSDSVNWILRIGLDREGLLRLPPGAILRESSGDSQNPTKAPAQRHHARARGSSGA